MSKSPSETTRGTTESDGGTTMVGTATTPTGVVRELLTAADAESEQFLLNPVPDVLAALAFVGNEIESVPKIRVLARHETLVWLRKNFPVASRMQNLVDDGSVEIRDTNLDNETQTLVGERGISTLVLVEDVSRYVRTEASELAATVRDSCEAMWDDGDPYSLRTPPLRAVLHTGEERFGESFREGFEASLTTVEDRSDPTDLHEVRLALLLAADGEHLHYDVSKWGETVGLASTASFSRHKTSLEELGVIDTEKVSVEIGRPRQRLRLTEKYRAMADEDGIDAVAAEVAVTE
jgi:hypothetical protein